MVAAAAAVALALAVEVLAAAVPCWFSSVVKNVELRLMIELSALAILATVQTKKSNADLFCTNLQPSSDHLST